MSTIRPNIAARSMRVMQINKIMGSLIQNNKVIKLLIYLLYIISIFFYPILALQSKINGFGGRVPRGQTCLFVLSFYNYTPIKEKSQLKSWDFVQCGSPGWTRTSDLVVTFWLAFPQESDFLFTPKFRGGGCKVSALGINLAQDCRRLYVTVSLT